MTNRTKISLLVALLLVIVGALASQFLTIRQTDYVATAHTRNAGELVRDVLVGQTFVSPDNDLSGIEVMFATYSNRENSGEVKLHLREAPGSTEDIRTASAQASVLQDNQFHRFTFDPIPDSKGKNYFFFVVAPAGQAGEAVTVDLNTTDPYHLGSAYVVRGQGSAVTSEDALARSGKPTQDVVFGTVHTLPVPVAVLNSAKESARNFVATWPEKKNGYYALSWLFLAALVFVLFGFVKTSGKFTAIVLAGLVVLAMLLRWAYASRLPLTNDEGNYLYDAASLMRGVLAGGDGYVKAPLVVLWMSLWQLITSSSLVGARLASVVIGSLTVLPMYYIGKYIAGRRAGLLSAAAWALLGAAVVGNVYLHTQSLTIFFVALGVAVLWAALRNHDPAPRELKINKTLYDVKWFLGAGLIFGLAAISRKSALGVGLVPLFMLLLESNNWRRRAKHTALVGAGFLLVVAGFLASAYTMYGTEGVVEAIGINSADDGANAVTEDDADQVREYSLRGMTPFFRESLPLILLALIGWGTLLENFLRRLIDKFVDTPPARSVRVLVDHVLPKVLWVFPLLVFFWARGFFFEYDGGVFHTLAGMENLWWAMLLAIIVVAVWPRRDEAGFEYHQQEGLAGSGSAPVVPKSTQPLNYIVPKTKQQHVQEQKEQRAMQADSDKDGELHYGSMHYLFAAIVIPLWILGLVFFYINWIKFHANYIIEFIPPLAVLSGVGLLMIVVRIRGKVFGLLVKILLLVVVLWAASLSNYITYTFEHTGTFDLGSIKEAAAWAKENIPQDQTIFTGAAAIPYLSGHRTALDIAHPRWYAYEFTRKNPERLNTFLPPAEEMVQAFRDTEWVLFERQTGFSFLMEYTEIERSLLETGEFEVVHEVENGSNTLQFYRRVKDKV